MNSIQTVILKRHKSDSVKSVEWFKKKKISINETDGNGLCETAVPVRMNEWI